MLSCRKVKLNERVLWQITYGYMRMLVKVSEISKISKISCLLVNCYRTDKFCGYTYDRHFVINFFFSSFLNFFSLYTTQHFGYIFFFAHFSSDPQIKLTIFFSSLPVQLFSCFDFFSIMNRNTRAPRWVRAHAGFIYLTVKQLRVTYDFHCYPRIK